jgi:hypothetical protein
MHRRLFGRDLPRQFVYACTSISSVSLISYYVWAEARRGSEAHQSYEFGICIGTHEDMSWISHAAIAW